MSATISAEAAGLQVARQGNSQLLARLRGLLNVLFPLVVVGLIWEVVARSGLYTQVLFPPRRAVDGCPGRGAVHEGHHARGATVRPDRHAHRSRPLVARGGGR